MRIAIIGISGAVGQELLDILEERQFPVSKLLLFGSKRSKKQSYLFREKSIEVRELKHNDDFKGIEIVFAAIEAEVSKQYASTITKYGALMIDLSSAFRMDKDVPLVVPEVNAFDALHTPYNIIANPNCTTILLLVVLNPIHNCSPIQEVRVSSYQSSSGAGIGGIKELEEQTRQVSAGIATKPSVFQYQLAMNVIPHIGGFTDSGYTEEEMKIYHETKKIMNTEVSVSATCVRVPTLRSHAEAVWIKTKECISIDTVRNVLNNADGVTIKDDITQNIYPLPLHSSGTDTVDVGRIRKDLCDPRGITLWLSGDQIRKGAALNAVQIAEYLIRNQ